MLNPPVEFPKAKTSRTSMPPRPLSVARLLFGLLVIAVITYDGWLFTAVLSAWHQTDTRAMMYYTLLGVMPPAALGLVLWMGRTSGNKSPDSLAGKSRLRVIRPFDDHA